MKTYRQFGLSHKKKLERERSSMRCLSTPYTGHVLGDSMFYRLTFATSAAVFKIAKIKVQTTFFFTVFNDLIPIFLFSYCCKMRYYIHAIEVLSITFLLLYEALKSLFVSLMRKCKILVHKKLPCQL